MCDIIGCPHHGIKTTALNALPAQLSPTGHPEALEPREASEMQPYLILSRLFRPRIAVLRLATRRWRSRQPGIAILEAGAIDLFDVRGSGANSPTYPSARATGPPLLAGLLLPDDIENGAVQHALALGLPGLRRSAQ